MTDVSRGIAYVHPSPCNWSQDCHCSVCKHLRVVHVYYITLKVEFRVHAQNYEVMDPAKPAWASQYGLKRRGTYYEGFVEDLECLLTKFKAEIVTTFGVR